MNRSTSFTPGLCFLAGLTLGLPDNATARDNFAEAYAEQIDRVLDRHFSERHGAVVIGLVDEHGSRIFSRGTLHEGSNRKVDGDTIFELGSVTKVFTSLLLLDAAQRGDVKMADPVAKHLPERVTVPSYEGRDITLFHLGAQSSGLPWHSYDFKQDPDRKTMLISMREAATAYTAEDLYAFLSSFELPGEPATGFQYSNTGMALLGHALARAAGTDYESRVIDRICKPLGMNNTGIALSPDQKARLARGHWADGEPAENINFKVMQPAGSFLSTANDLLKFLEANLGLIDSPLTAAMKTSQIVRYTGHQRFGTTAMPWFDERIYHPPGRKILGHGGGGFGYLAFIGLETQQRRGVVILTSQLGFNPFGIGWSLLQGAPLTFENITYWVKEQVGLGFTLEPDEQTGLPRVGTVWPTSPAGRAGLRTGHTMTKINGTGLAGKTVHQCLSMFRGKAGTSFEIEVIDPTEQTTSTVDVALAKFVRVTGDTDWTSTSDSKKVRE
ncbi:MAG: serine hydrolase [Verrucomicrobiota bacterium]